MFSSWDQLDAGLKAAIGFFAALSAFLGGGKLIRVNKLDSANTAVNVKAAETEAVIQDNIQTELKRLSEKIEDHEKKLVEQADKISELKQEIAELQHKVDKLNAGRTRALRFATTIREEIKVEDPWTEKHKAYLDFVIDALTEYEEMEKKAQVSNNTELK